MNFTMPTRTTTNKKPKETKATYNEMIKEAIVSLKEKNGSSRQELKKYVKEHFPVSDISFDSRFNLALKRGVANGVFLQPKGASGAVKLSKSPGKAELKARKPRKAAKVVEAKKNVKSKKEAPKRPKRRASRAKA